MEGDEEVDALDEYLQSSPTPSIEDARSIRSGFDSSGPPPVSAAYRPFEAISHESIRQSWLQDGSPARSPVRATSPPVMPMTGNLPWNPTGMSEVAMAASPPMVEVGGVWHTRSPSPSYSQDFLQGTVPNPTPQRAGSPVPYVPSCGYSHPGYGWSPHPAYGSPGTMMHPEYSPQVVPYDVTDNSGVPRPSERAGKKVVEGGELDYSLFLKILFLKP